MPGSLRQVVVAKGMLYGVNSAGSIYFSPSVSGRWILSTGSGLTQISFDGYTVCGVNANQQIWCAKEGVLEGKAKWFLVAGTLTHVSVKDSTSLPFP